MSYILVVQTYQVTGTTMYTTQNSPRIMLQLFARVSTAFHPHAHSTPVNDWHALPHMHAITHTGIISKNARYSRASASPCFCSLRKPVSGTTLQFSRAGMLVPHSSAMPSWTNFERIFSVLDSRGIRGFFVFNQEHIARHSTIINAQIFVLAAATAQLSWTML